MASSYNQLPQLLTYLAYKRCTLEPARDSFPQGRLKNIKTLFQTVRLGFVISGSCSQKHMCSMPGRELWYVHLGLLKNGVAAHMATTSQSARSQWMETVASFGLCLLGYSWSGAWERVKTAEEIMLGQCWKYTWNMPAFRWYGMLSSFSYGKLLLLTARLTAENICCNVLNLD